LTAGHVSGGENAGYAGHLFGVRGDVAAFVDSDAEFVEHTFAFGPEKTHRQKHKIHIKREFGSGDFLQIASFELHSYCLKLGHLAIAAGEVFRHDAVFAITAFFMCG
jgi:hypothetical protein